MWNTPSLPLFQGPLRPEVVIPIVVPTMGQIELFNHLSACKQMTDAKLNY